MKIGGPKSSITGLALSKGLFYIRQMNNIQNCNTLPLTILEVKFHQSGFSQSQKH